MKPLSHTHHFEPGSDPAAPPLLLLHGTGGSERDLIPLARRVSPGSAILSPRGNVSENGAPRFFARLAEGVFDPAEIARRAEELADFIAAGCERYRLDTTRLTALGFSNGANIAAAVLLIRPASLGGAILLRPMVALTPSDRPQLSGRRILISSGAHDPLVPAEHPGRLAEIFRSGGAEVTLRVHKAGHGLVAGDLESAREFLNPAIAG